MIKCERRFFLNLSSGLSVETAADRYECNFGIDGFIFLHTCQFASWQNANHIFNMQNCSSESGHGHSCWISAIIHPEIALFPMEVYAIGSRSIHLFELIF